MTKTSYKVQRRASKEYFVLNYYLIQKSNYFYYKDLISKLVHFQITNICNHYIIFLTPLHCLKYINNPLKPNDKEGDKKEVWWEKSQTYSLILILCNPST